MVSNFKSSQERHTVGRALAFLLRDQAPLMLEVDKYGYAPVEAVVYTMQQQGFNVQQEHITEVVNKDPQHRFELFQGKIRAKAGHRYQVEPTSEPMIPPEFLYHGTSAKSAERIVGTGILSMGKAYVHLASTVQRCKIVGLRKSKTPVILRIKSREAHNAGIRFWKSGQVSPDGEIILSDKIPSQFVERIDE